jgi:hypothetical protein
VLTSDGLPPESGAREKSTLTIAGRHMNASEKRPARRATRAHKIRFESRFFLAMANSGPYSEFDRGNFFRVKRGAMRAAGDVR